MRHKAESGYGACGSIYPQESGECTDPHRGRPGVPDGGCRGMEDRIDVMILCGGSATDLPEQTPAFAKMFNVIDSFDTHAKIPEHYANVDCSGKRRR